ncbi:MAG: trypsin-like peptidase domain-containing protein [Candidatus Sulfotelmatobacter sp.]
MAAVLLLVAAMSAQNSLGTNKGRHLDIPAISREANGAVVSIVMSDKDGHPIVQGSGFLISKDGHVVTNYHVISEGSSAVIRLPGGVSFAVDGVIAFDKDRDVAVIKAHGNGFRTLTLGDSDRLQVGEEVVAIGNPLSLESTVSNGIVSAVRTIQTEGGKFVQITAPISPGSSGGPLFNMAGKVVGITTSHLIGGENLNFAIPINDVKPLLTVPDSQALLALPNEPESPPVRSDATEQTDGNNPSLEETQQWMKDNVGDWQSDAVRWFADDGQIVEPSPERFLDGVLLISCAAGCLPVYSVTGDSALNVRDFRPHNWRRIERTHDLKFEGCSMIVADFDSISTSKGPLPNLDAPGKTTFTGSVRFAIQHYDPRVKVQEDLTTEDMTDTHGDVVVPKGTAYANGLAWVTADPVSQYKDDRQIHLDLSYPFAERFAKALRHAITLCGGKPSTF